MNYQPLALVLSPASSVRPEAAGAALSSASGLRIKESTPVWLKYKNTFSIFEADIDFSTELERMKDLHDIGLNFTYVMGEKGRIDFVAPYTPRKARINQTEYHTIDVIEASEEPDTYFELQNNYLYRLDINRLLDWLAFDISHLDYDPDEYSVSKVSNYIGKAGAYLTAEGDIVNELVPKNYREKISDFDLRVDLDSNSIYVKKQDTKTALNYYGQEFEPLKRRGIPYERLVHYQDAKTTLIYYVYMKNLADQMKVRLRLAGLGNGFIDLYVRGDSSALPFFQAIESGAKVVLFEAHRFFFRPTAHRVQLSQQ